MNTQIVNQVNLGGGLQVNVALQSIGNPTLNIFIGGPSQSGPTMLPNPAAAYTRQPDNYYG